MNTKTEKLFKEKLEEWKNKELATLENEKRQFYDKQENSRIDFNRKLVEDIKKIENLDYIPTGECCVSPFYL